MARVLFNKQNEIDVPTLILQNKNFDTIGTIVNASDLIYRENFNSANELSFMIYKEANGEVNEHWDKIVDFKVLYIPEFQERYEIRVSSSEDSSVIKTVTGTSLCESELSQVRLYDININTEDDIARDDYDENLPTVFYRNPLLYDSYDWSDNRYDYIKEMSTPEAMVNEKMRLLKAASLLHRTLEKAEHFKIGHVDESLMEVQREFTISGTDIYAFYSGELSEEISCVFIYNSMDRSVSAYDLYNTCYECDYRGDFEDVCPECGSTNFGGKYGEDTTVFVTSENLASKVSLETNSDSMKNCFYVEGGDDIINTALRSINPNGSQYIYMFNDDTKSDMPEELSKILSDYTDMYNEYNSTKVFNLNVTDVANYNKVVDYVRLKFGNADGTVDDDYDYVTLEESLVGYSSTTNAMYEAIDLHGFIEDSMLPTIDISGVGLNGSMTNIINGFANGFTQFDANGKPQVHFRNEIAVLKNTTATQTTVENAIKNTALLFYGKAYYKLTLNTKRYTVASAGGKGSWVGNFVLESLTQFDENENPMTAASADITLAVGSDYELYVQQEIYRAIAKADELETKDITSLKLSDADFSKQLNYYSLTELHTLKISFEACWGVIMNSAMSSDTTYKQLYDKYYKFYYNRAKLIDAEIVVRDQQMKYVRKIYYMDAETFEVSGLLYDIRTDVQKKLNFKNYVIDNSNEDLWKTFCSYRREDKYSNQNYISDGLTNSEVIADTKALFDVAAKELYKAAHPQYTISTEMNNLLAIKEFVPLKDSFSVGNWIRVEVDEKIYRLRLLSYQITFDSLQSISVEFSTLEQLVGSMSDIKSILSSASQISSSYDSVKKQVDKSASATAQVSKWVNDGLKATQTKFSNADNQSLVIDKYGLLARRFSDIDGVYDSNQLKIVSNGLYTTHDNWQSIDTGIGAFSYVDPETGQTVDDYGIIARNIVGKLFLGEQLKIYGANGSLKFDGSGLQVSNGVNFVIINPNDTSKLFRVSTVSNGVYTDKMYTDSSGNLHLSGNIDGGSININNAFQVTSAGNIVSSGNMSLGNGKLVYNGTNLTITGNISGSNISGSSFSGGSININNAFKVDSSGNITTSGTTNIMGNVKVYGTVYAAKELFIGVWDPNNEDISNVSMRSILKIDADGDLASVTTQFKAYNQAVLFSHTDNWASQGLSINPSGMPFSIGKKIYYDGTDLYIDSFTVSQSGDCGGRITLENDPYTQTSCALDLSLFNFRLLDNAGGNWHEAFKFDLQSHKWVGDSTCTGSIFPETYYRISNATYNLTHSNAPNVTWVGGGGYMRRSTSSSIKYKHDIEDLDIKDIKSLYSVPLRTFKYNEGYMDKEDSRYMKDIPGFIVEELAEVFPISVDFKEDGSPEMWNYKIILPAALKLIQDLNERLIESNKEIKQLKEQIGGLGLNG